MRSRTILVPIDFSPASGRGLSEAFTLKGYSRIHLLHVVTGPIVAHKVEEVIQSARAELRKFCQGDGALPPVQYHVRLGIAFREILQFAEENEVDLIVLVRNEEPKRVLGEGHTADLVARYARCAVMLVPQSRGKEDPQPGKAAKQ